MHWRSSILSSEWWDPDKRFLKAGTLKLVIQSTLWFQILEKPDELCDRFGMDFEEYKTIVGSKSLKVAEGAATKKIL